MKGLKKIKPYTVKYNFLTAIMSTAFVTLSIKLQVCISHWLTFAYNDFNNRELSKAIVLKYGFLPFKHKLLLIINETDVNAKNFKLRFQLT